MPGTRPGMTNLGSIGRTNSQRVSRVLYLWDRLLC
jgi:hypothetical protein